MNTSFTDKGGWWVAGQFALMFAVGAAAPLWPGDGPAAAQVAGAVLMLLGAWAGIAGAVTLGRNRTAYPVPKAGAQLVQHGIYARIRHPLYTSLMLLGFGWALWWGSLPALAFAVALTAQLRFKAVFEERQLLQAFPEYAEYSRRVPRFIPRPGRAANPLPLAALLALGCFAPTAAGIDLADAIAEARRNNPDAALARKRIAAAEAAVAQADAIARPRLSVRSDYHRTDNPLGVFGAALNQRSFGPSLNFNDVPDADNLNIGGTLTVPLYTGGRITATREAARQQARASERMNEAVENQLAFEVTRVFLSIRKTRAFIEAAEAAVRSFAENLATARKRFDAGKALKADVLDLEVRLAQAREELVQARNANELARRALANLLGRGLTGSDPLPDASDAAPTLAVPDDATPMKRPELDALQRRRAAAEANVRAAQSGNRPKVSAFARGEYNHGWKFNGNGENYTAGVLVNWNPWDGFLTRGKVREARAQVDIAAEQERRLRLAIEFEIQQARLNLNTATERVGVSSKAVELAAESAQLTRVRFEQGLALATQLIDAETALTAARVRLAQAEADRLIAIAALRKALGLPQLETTAEAR